MSKVMRSDAEGDDFPLNCRVHQFFPDLLQPRLRGRSCRIVKVALHAKGKYVMVRLRGAERRSTVQHAPHLFNADFVQPDGPRAVLIFAVRYIKYWVLLVKQYMFDLQHAELHS